MFDLGRKVERDISSTTVQMIYDVSGRELALMVNGSTLGEARVGLGAGIIARYDSSGLISRPLLKDAMGKTEAVYPLTSGNGNEYTAPEFPATGTLGVIHTQPDWQA